MIRWISVFLAVHSLALANETPLLFPQSSVFQFTIATSMPIVMDRKGGIVFSSGFQFNYALPWNSSQFEPVVIHARDARSIDLVSLGDVYASFEHILERHGWNDGRQCLLRTICELAETPLEAVTTEDVISEVIRLLLTSPSEDLPEADHSDRWSVANAYLEAELLGRSGDNECATAYGACIGSPLDSFTEIEFEI